MAKTLFGGSFAPPLSDEKLTLYRTTIDLMIASPLKDALNALMPCCEKWWGLPEPNGTNTTPHPVGVGVVIDLQDDHKAELDEHIPWEHELDTIQKLFNDVETETVLANSVKLQAWALAVRDHIVTSFFPDPSVYERIWESLKNVAQWLGFLSDDSKVEFEAQRVKAQECHDKIVEALTTKSYPPVRRPILAPTPVRDMAFHLLWHVRELNLGREPMTTDRLSGTS